MGRTGYGIDKMIINELENGEKTGKDLEIAIVNKVRKGTEKRYEEVRKNFYYNLNKLLEDKKRIVEITGYKPIGSIEHSFKHDGFIFELIKTDYDYIRTLLDKLECSDFEEIKKSRIKLQGLFKRKFEQYETQRVNYLGLPIRSTKEQKELKETGSIKPTAEDEIKSRFNKILFNINLNENPKFSKNIFAWALSDEEESMEWFKFFVNENNFNNIRETLLK